jgi:exosortase
MANQVSHLAESPVASAKTGARWPLLSLLPIACVLACFWWVVIRQLGAQWSVYYQYHYGWAVPFICGYLVWRRIQEPRMGGCQSDAVRSAAGQPLSFREAVFVLALCALAYAPTRFLHEANPVWRLTSLLLALEVIVLTLCFVYIVGGFSALRRFAFPISFFVVAVPWPSELESFLVQTLTRWNVGATVELLGLFGVPAIQHGNVIEIGTGMVGIDEACSGIRSLQATFMISLLLGEYYFLSVTRRVFCVVAGFACSFLFNLARTSFLTWVGATKGTKAIAHWHDPAGVTILVACFFSLWAAARLLARNRDDETAGLPPSADFSLSHGSFLLIAAAALGAWLALVEAGTELWFRSHEKQAHATIAWDLNSGTAGPGFTNVKIPGDVLGQFRADESAHRLWRDADGITWQLFYFRWLPAQSLDRRVAVQLAKAHGPEKCLPAVGMTMKSDLGVVTVPAGSLTLAFRQYVFTAEGQPLHVFYGLYEDPDGSAVLANRRKSAAKRIGAALAGSRNYGQRLLEIAISGPEQPEDAKAVLVKSLASVIRVEK